MLEPIITNLKIKKKQKDILVSLEIINQSNQSLHLEKSKIGPPIISDETILYNCFSFSHYGNMRKEPRWRLNTPIHQELPTENDFFVLPPSETYKSNWMSLSNMYDFEGTHASLIRYHSFHELYWPKEKYGYALQGVKSEWVTFPSSIMI